MVRSEDGVTLVGWGDKTLVVDRLMTCGVGERFLRGVLGWIGCASIWGLRSLAFDSTSLTWPSMLRVGLGFFCLLVTDTVLERATSALGVGELAFEMLVPSRCLSMSGTGARGFEEGGRVTDDRPEWAPAWDFA